MEPEVICIASGTNSRGNKYYKYIDGSYSYDNMDRSTYHNGGKGRAVYTNPQGHTFDLEAPPV
ncbi:hypothetical protein FIBSPDRAFT_858048 [Athelia psychrophila]|uniref:Uncharacterized protein n=1 Tax=Athelia psychrophila TaxID=1759441 RepID=A0A166MD94_9AGAM|nr:hypothetical protein FIBSPDRAFT_859315 [Fibularhizoctonia sp. CBS 109695]KZP23884.1 hypothetical protein FIBSPDRAFT_858048 [Fibularhizoctonia sp. CBS 109695]